MVTQFSCTIQGTALTSNILLPLLVCYDLVLMIEWLITLGNITWNFEKLYLNFLAKGKTFVLSGSSKERVKIMRRK